MNVLFLKKGVVSLSVLSMLVQPLAYAGSETTSNQSIEVLKIRSPIDVMFENYMTEGEVSTAMLAAMVVDLKDGVNTPEVYKSRRDELRGYVRSYLVENKGGSPEAREKIQSLELAINTYIKTQQAASFKARARTEGLITLGFIAVGGTFGSVMTARAARAQKASQMLLEGEVVTIQAEERVVPEVAEQVEAATQSAASNAANQAEAQAEVKAARWTSELYARIAKAIRENPNASVQEIISGIQDLVSGGKKFGSGVLTSAIKAVRELYSASTGFVLNAGPALKAVRAITRYSFIREADVTLAKAADFTLAPGKAVSSFTRFSETLEYAIVKQDGGGTHLLVKVLGDNGKKTTYKVTNKWAILTLASRNSLNAAVQAGKAQYFTYVEDGKVYVKAIQVKSATQLKKGLQSASDVRNAAISRINANPYVNSGLGAGIIAGTYVGLATVVVAEMTVLSSPLDRVYGEQLPRFKQIISEIDSAK